MKKIFFILLFSFAAAYCFGQTELQSCAAFRTGKFAYRDSANHIIQVIRKGGKQEERDTKNNIITKLKIKWTGDCEYELTQIWSNSKARRKQNRAVSRVVITKSNGNESYEYNCGCKDREIRGETGTMVRLNE
jgi:hypothetical protein